MNIDETLKKLGDDLLQDHPVVKLAHKELAGRKLLSQTEIDKICAAVMSGMPDAAYEERVKVFHVAINKIAEHRAIRLVEDLILMGKIKILGLTESGDFIPWPVDLEIPGDGGADFKWPKFL